MLKKAMVALAALAFAVALAAPAKANAQVSVNVGIGPVFARPYGYVRPYPYVVTPAPYVAAPGVYGYDAYAPYVYPETVVVGGRWWHEPSHYAYRGYVAPRGRGWRR